MKAFRIVLLLLFIAETVEAFSPRWRWRNDDGDIFLATWKDSVNCPITYRSEGNIRLRLSVVPSDSGITSVSMCYSNTPYYDATDSTRWTRLSAVDTGIFFLSDSKYLIDGAFYRDDARLNIWHEDGWPEYGGTITIDSSSQYPLAVMSFNEGYEFEYCLKPNPAKIPEGSVYYFFPFLNNANSPYDPDPPGVRFPPFYWNYHKVKTGEVIKVQFTDSLNGWYQTYAENNYELWRTTDGGRTWMRQSSGLSICPFVFVTRDTGWAVVDNSISRSTDGGMIWTPRDAGFVVNRYLPNSIYFLDAQHGWVTCQDDPMMRTSNGGETWEPINSPRAYLLSSYFFNERVGFTIGESIYKTTDGGASWRLVQSVYDLPQAPAAGTQPNEATGFPLTPYVGQIQFTDSSRGWALTYNGKLCRTVDGGEHWMLQHTFRTPRALAMHFSGGLNGWIVGERGMILATKDGGETWEKRPSGTGHDLRMIEAVSDHLWIGAKDGTVLSSASGGWTTAVNNEEKALPVPQDVVLYPNYPNPFNPSTTIRYAMPNVSHVTIRIFDLLGREVSTLVDEQMPAGTHEITWNGTRCASGIYLCRMQAGAYQHVRLMALVK